ncbi:hypothetical protein GCM10009558_053560 [Virgisporangium aurantiacum]
MTQPNAGAAQIGSMKNITVRPAAPAEPVRSFIAIGGTSIIDESPTMLTTRAV